MPAGTSTELRAKLTDAKTSIEGEDTDSRAGRVCGAANGYAPRRDHLGDTEVDGDGRTRRGSESSPGHVRLGADEEEHILPAGSAAGSHLIDRCPAQIRVQSVVASSIVGRPSAVVDVHVVVEGQHGRRLARRAQFLRCRRCRTGGIDPSGEHHDHDRLVEVEDRRRGDRCRGRGRSTTDPPAPRSRLVRAVASARRERSSEFLQASFGLGGRRRPPGS